METFNLFAPPAGEKTWPYHYEQGAEEWLLMVSGKPTLRSPDGEQELQPGDTPVCRGDAALGKDRRRY